MVIIFAVFLYYLNSREGKAWTGLEPWLLQCQWNCALPVELSGHFVGQWLLISLSTLLYASETIQHALYTHTKSKMPSTCANSDEASCFRQACQACLPSSPRDACPGWDTCAEWKMASSPRTSNWPGPPCAMRMSVQEGPQGMRLQPSRAWGRDFISNQTAIKDQGWHQIVGGEEREPVRRKEDPQEAETSVLLFCSHQFPTTGYICGKCHHICIYTAATVAVHLLSQVQMPLSLETKGCQQQIVDVWYQINEILLELQMETKKNILFFVIHSSNEISLTWLHIHNLCAHHWPT